MIENLNWLAKQGITLSGYHAVTHPSEPNYVAAIGGDYFGMQNDDFNQIAKNVSTVIDLLEDKGISWAEYQEVSLTHCRPPHTSLAPRHLA